MASLVPEPIEKCAVWAASPTSTTLPCDQCGTRTVTKLIHLELLASSGRPCSASSNSWEAERDRALVADSGRELAGAVQAGCAPHVDVGLDDERAPLQAVGIGVGLKDPVLGLGDEELERVIDEVGPAPHVLTEAGLERGVKACRGAHAAVGAVGGDDEIGPAEVLEGDLVAEAQLGPERRRAVLQQRQQLAAAEGREAVATRAGRVAPVVDVDVGPAHETRHDLGVALGVGVLEDGERLVGEHDPEAERVGGCVALEDGHLPVGPQPAHENGEVEPGRPAPGDGNPHRLSGRSGGYGRTERCDWWMPGADAGPDV